jgi:hypothetical protein
MDGLPKRKGLARRYPIDFIVERQLEEVTQYLNQRMETGNLYLWQMVDTNLDRDEFSVTLIRNGRRTSQAWLLLRRWEGTHTRLQGSMNFVGLRIRQTLIWALYIHTAILMVIVFWAAIMAWAATPLLVLCFSLLMLLTPFVLFIPFAILSEVWETRRLVHALKDYLLKGLR